MASDGAYRTSGDGMEQDSSAKSDILANIQLNKQNQGRRPPSASAITSLQTLPSLHTFQRTTPCASPSSLGTTKSQVPQRPVYPGSVAPLNSYSGSTLTSTVAQKSNKNNLDINVLANQVSNLRTQEMNAAKAASDEVDGSSANADEVKQLRAELAKANETNEHLQSQLKFQEQVNAELKSLLVASLGEDLETQVNLLTKDKLQLTHELLDTARNLTTHTEQMEYLVGQCEVWRSKFLASSIMVEELARWKADLTQKNKLLSEASDGLLNVMQQLREMQWQIVQNLKFINKLRHLNLPAMDVTSLTAECVNILQQMVLHSGLGVPDINLKLSTASKDDITAAEKAALQALEYSSQPLMATEDAMRALFGQVQRPYQPPNALPDSGGNIQHL